MQILSLDNLKKKYCKRTHARNLYTKNQHPFSDVDGATRGSFKMIISLPSSELTSETLWRGSEINQHWIIQVAFKIKVDSKCTKTVFFSDQGWFPVNLEIKVNFISCLWNEGWFLKCVSTGFFYLLFVVIAVVGKVSALVFVNYFPTFFSGIGY